MKRLSFLFAFSFSSLFLLITLQKNQAIEREGVITQDLQNQMERVQGEEWIRINIAMRDQVDLSLLERKVAPLSKNERRETVVRALKEFTQRDQESILQFLREREKDGEVRRIRSLWIANVIATEVKKGVIETLSTLEGIRSIDWDEERNMLLFRKDESPPRIASLEWNISLINAPAVWSQGFTGQGVIVGNLDTGVNYNHVDLQDHFWTNPGEIPGNSTDDDGNGYVDDVYGYDFAYNDGNPMDGHGHGTHTAGTVAGDGTAGDTTGVAPDAEIMALKVLNDVGGGLESDVWEAIAYAVDNGAQVMTLSIGWSHAWGPDRTSWRNSFNNALAAGVHSSVAAGNEDNFYGAPDNVRTPGDCPPPWLHPDQTLTGGLSGVVTVGMTDNSDVIDTWSSKGPVEWDFSPWNDYPYSPEIGLIDPDVSAPGVCVTSLDAFSINGYEPCWTGTSMATPHVAGLMALMLSKNPVLTPATVDDIIETTALELGAAGKDNSYGSGRIRALEAFNAVPAPNTPYLQMIGYTVSDTTAGDGDGRPEGSETCEIVVTLENGVGFQNATLVQATLSTSDTTLTLIDSSASFPDIPSGSSGNNSGDPFLFSVNSGILPHWSTFIIDITAQPNNFSKTDSFTIRVGRPDILLVDDDGGSPYESYYRGPLNNLLIPYDDWNNLLSGSPGSELNEYSCVIWFTGNEDSATLTPQDETDLSTFMDGGGNLFLSGQNIGEEIGGSSTFYSNYLQAVFLEANANDNLLSGVTSDPISNGLNLVIQGANGAGNANSEDKITPLGASSVFTYTNVSGTGAQRYDSGTFRVVYFAFPFEAIHGAGSFASRDTVMSRVLNWVCPSSVGVEEPESGDLRFPISDFRLLQNVPNPFTQFTLISFQIPQSPFVKGGIKGDFAEGGTRGIPVQLAIYDITGRLVKTLVDETKEPGVYQLPITPPQVDQLPGSGVYFYRLKVGGNGNTPLVMTRKMTLLK